MQGFHSVGRDNNIQTVWHEIKIRQGNEHLEQSARQRLEHEDSRVNSLHSVYKKRGKYSTSSEFKT